MKKKKIQKKNLKKYETKTNNYRLVIVLLVLLITGVIIYTQNKEETDELEPIYNSISGEVTNELDEENEQIRKLRTYTNGGDTNTFKIYQSMYTEEPVTLSTLSNENILYITYKYIEKNTNLAKYNKYITCDIAKKINIAKNIYQCGGNKYNISTYQYNTYITKDLLKKTAQEIFNINLTEFTNFYTNEDNLCYFVNNEFTCVTKKIQHTNPVYNTEFIRAFLYENKVEILEEYYFIKNNTKYKSFNSKEEGSSFYITTYEKTNGKYHWVETKPYKN